MPTKARRQREAKRSPEERLIARDWAEFFRTHGFPWCWWCGRGLEHRPEGWTGPPWLIERAHIVNNPRREDRRAAVLLCSWCHKVQHGEQLVLPGVSGGLVSPTLANMLWLKSRFDPGYYDRAFLSANSIRVLPRAQRPSRDVLRGIVDRRPAAWHIVKGKLVIPSVWRAEPFNGEQ